MIHESSRYLRALWRAALACFVLAAATGLVFRFGLISGLPVDLSFDNIRRAHSHLMFFSWVTPALMALIAARLQRRTQRRFGRALRVIVWTNLGLGLSSFIPFLLDGYGSTAILGVSVPLSIILSTASMFAWYAFAVVYWRHRRGAAGHSTFILWDVAVVALVVSSIGAWARGVFMGLGVDDPFLTEGVIHFFLGLFSDGWLALAALALVYDHLQVEVRGASRWLTGLVVAGLPVTFLLGMPQELVPAGLWRAATIGGLLTGAGFLGHALILWRRQRARRGLWALALVAVAFKGAAQMLFVVPTVSQWAEAAGLRMLYLHVLFLGFVTVVLLESARLTWRNITTTQSRCMQAGVVVLLVTMLPTTGLWPAALIGPASLWLVAAGALPAVLVAASIVASPQHDADGA